MEQNNTLKAYPAQALLNKLLESAMIEVSKQYQTELPARPKGRREADDED